MNVSRIWRKSVSAVLLNMLLSSAAQAAMTTDELQSVLVKAQIFVGATPPTLSLTGSELMISAYKRDGATERDCKIDAVLAAKAVFAADSAISRVTVMFHDVRATSEYDEVPVTLGDIAAFKGGEISQVQLLSAIKLTRHGTSSVQSVEGSTVTRTTASSESGTTGSAASSPATAASAAQPEKKIAMVSPGEPPAPRSGEVTYSSYGVTFNYPRAWTTENPQSSNVLVRFYMQGSGSQSIMEMRVYARKDVSPQDVVDSDVEDMFRQSWKAVVKKSVMQAMPEIGKYIGDHVMEESEEHEERFRQWKQKYQQTTGKKYHTSIYRPVTLPESTFIGAGKSVKCLQRGYYATPLVEGHHEERREESSFTEYIQYVVFESQAYTIQLDMMCPSKDAYGAATQFNNILANLKVAGARPKASPAPHHK